MDKSTINDSGGGMGANNDSMTTMGQTLRESQLPTSSTVNAKRHSCDGTRECTEHVQGRSDSAGDESEQRLCCCPWMGSWKPEGKRNGGRPKQPGVALWRRRERQTRMEHMGNSKTGSKLNRQQRRGHVRALCASWREEI